VEMAASLESIESEALLLPTDQRLTLAHRILASVESTSVDGADTAWEKEIKERIKKYDAGLSQGIPGPDVFAELDKILKK
jgi:putative addiction module component (TIGR02574 family)